MNSIDASFDWEYFAAEGNRQAVNPWMYKQIKKNNKLKSLVPENIYTTLQNEYYYTLNRNTKIFKELENILKILNDEGIDVILLKGAYLLPFVYKDLGARSISDLDILVKYHNIDKALEALKKMGFKHNFIPYSKWHKNYIIKHEKHVPPLFKNEIKIDLHSKFDFYGYYKNNEEFWETTIKTNYNDNYFYSLCEKHLKYLLISHFKHHYDNNDAQLKELVDIYIFLVRDQFEEHEISNLIKNLFYFEDYSVPNFTSLAREENKLYDTDKKKYISSKISDIHGFKNNFFLFLILFFRQNFL